MMRKIIGFCLVLIGMMIPAAADQIHEAVSAGDFEVVMALLEGNPKPAGIPDENGMTPLHWVSINGHRGICELLIKSGADLNVTDKWNLTPLSRANQLGHRDIVNLLLENGVKLPEEYRDIQRHAHYAAVKGHKRLFERLMERLSAGGMENPEGGTFLHSAAEGGVVEMAGMLLDQSIPVDRSDRYGWTALHVASQMGHLDVVKLLADKGAGLDLRTIEGGTAIQYALQGGHDAVVEYLRSKGVDQSPPAFPDLRGKYLGLKTPGETPEIFALGIVSTRDRCHSSLAVSPDGREIYWSPGWRKILFMKQENGRWLPPRIPSFYSDLGDTEPVFSHDGRKLYFLSQRPLEGKGKSEKENIWYVERIADGWSEARPLSPVVNAMALHWQISFAKNGSLYFGSDESGGKGGSDIYVSKFVDGAYTKPVNLGDAVNTDYNDFSPYIAPDEDFLLFTRQGPVGSRKADLLVSFREDDGSWSKAVGLGPEINSEQGDYCPMVTPDGKFLFFVSIRTGNQDLYWVDAAVIEK